MFARYYNSATGRFLSPDWSAKVAPVPYAKLGIPQSLNLYSYVYNNPLSKNDPDGHVAAGTGCRLGKEKCDAAVKKSNADFDKHTQQLATDSVKHLKSTKVSIEIGVGEEKKGTGEGVTGTVGGSIHIKETASLKEHTTTVEAEGGASVGIGDKKIGLGGSAGLKMDNQDGTITPTGDVAPSASNGSKDASSSLMGNETELGFADYDGIGGGASVSVDSSALHDVAHDLLVMGVAQ